MLANHILRLTRILGEIVELLFGRIEFEFSVNEVAVALAGELQRTATAEGMIARFGAVEAATAACADVEPWTVTKCEVGLLVRGEHEFGAQGLVGLAIQQWKNVETVWTSRCGASERGECAEEVDLANELIGGTAGLNFSGPTGDEWNAVAAFPRVELKTEKVAVEPVTGLPGLLAAWLSIPPLSLVRMTSVFPLNFNSSSVRISSPTIQSNSWMKSPYSPAWLLPLNLGPGVKG